MSILNNYPPSDACPCGSTKKAQFCCLQSGQWNKSSAKVWPPQPATGYSHPSCAVADLKDCGGEITREHFISETLLRNNSTLSTVEIAGLRWQNPKAFDSIGINALVSKILCKRHNEALSLLDNAIGFFGQSFHDFDDDFKRSAPREDLRIVSGDDIEKWMLKAFLGLVASSGVSGKLKAEHIRLLYGNCPWPAGGGLYFDQGTGGKVYHSNTIEISTLVDRDGIIRAGRFVIAGLPFKLAVGSPDHPEKFGIHRPKGIIFNKNGIEKLLEISWGDKKCSERIELKEQGRYDGLPPNWPIWTLQKC